MRRIYAQYAVFLSGLLLTSLLLCASDSFAQVCCISSGNPGVLSFGAINPTSPGPINAAVTTQPVIRCTNGLPFTVTSRSNNAGGAFGGPPITGVLSEPGGHTINYTFTHIGGGTGGGGTGGGCAGGNPARDRPLNIGGTVYNADYADAYVCEGACSYTDTVTIQVTY